MSGLEIAGYSADEAWEMTREMYLIIPPESDDDQNFDEVVRLYGQAIALQNKVLQILDEISIESDRLTSMPTSSLGGIAGTFFSFNEDSPEEA